MTQGEIAADSQDANELELLSLLVEDYENRHYPIPSPNPIEAILCRIEQMGLDEKELSKILGGRQRKSDILKRRRRLSLQMIRRLHKRLNIPAEVLIRNYPLQSE